MLTNSPNNVSSFAGKTTQFCGFEDEQICGFYQEDNNTDSLDWTRGSGSTPSDDTGPSTDHTCGNNFGKTNRREMLTFPVQLLNVLTFPVRKKHDTGILFLAH